MSPRCKKWFIFSIIINLLLLGMCCGHMYKYLTRGYHDHHPRIEALVAEYGEEKVQHVRKQLKQLWKAHKPNRKTGKALRRKAGKLLQQENFDLTAYQNVVQEIHNQRSAMMQGFTTSLVELAASFDRKEREILAQLMRRPPHHDRAPHRPQHPKHPPQEDGEHHRPPPPPPGDDE